MNVPRAKIDELVEYLQGTCNTLEQGMEICGIDPAFEDEITAAIDDEIFLCAGCGWWDEISACNDDSGEQLCPDCVE